MRKTFKLTASNKAPERQVEAVKHEITKYMAREKRKSLPEGVDYWDFDCKIGKDEESSAVIFVNEIRKKIDSFVTDSCESFYIEVLVRPGKHNPSKTPRKSNQKD